MRKLGKMGKTRATGAGGALVFAGASLGAAARYAATVFLIDPAAAPLAILVINVLGALLLGVLVGVLAAPAHPEADSPTASRSRNARLFLGTGLLGGFTTYSALALYVAQPLQAGNWAGALGYGLTTVLLGGVAAFVGLWVGRQALSARRTVLE